MNLVELAFFTDKVKEMVDFYYRLLGRQNHGGNLSCIEGFGDARYVLLGELNPVSDWIN